MNRRFGHSITGNGYRFRQSIVAQFIRSTCQVETFSTISLNGCYQVLTFTNDRHTTGIYLCRKGHSTTGLVSTSHHGGVFCLRLQAFYIRKTIRYVFRLNLINDVARSKRNDVGFFPCRPTKGDSKGFYVFDCHWLEDLLRTGLEIGLHPFGFGDSLAHGFHANEVFRLAFQSFIGEAVCRGLIRAQRRVARGRAQIKLQHVARGFVYGVPRHGNIHRVSYPRVNLRGREQAVIIDARQLVGSVGTGCHCAQQQASGYVIQIFLHGRLRLFIDS